MDKIILTTKTNTNGYRYMLELDLVNKTVHLGNSYELDGQHALYIRGLTLKELKGVQRYAELQGFTVK